MKLVRIDSPVEKILTLILLICNLASMNLEKLAPKAAQAENFLKALANRHRLMILCELHKGETGVSALQKALGLSSVVAFATSCPSA